MKSFISELEDPVVQRDIIELGRRIEAFRNGTLDAEKFRALRLARGVYGQRQQGVQMIRIKLPFGKVTVRQLLRICDVSDTYSTGKLHITTRQDIQIHYVSLDRTPELWADLERDDITLREACGNTVRNVTASPAAGILPDEVFDVSPYAHLMFRYFLRKPFGQELGRKFKIAFSSNERDDAFAYIHDLGLIPKIEVQDGKEVRGFRVMVGGGLGSQPYLAQCAFEFLVAERLIPYTEAIIRVFDRHGERNSRHKARLKFLLAKIGLEEFQRLVSEEANAVQYSEEDYVLVEQNVVPATEYIASTSPKTLEGYEQWKVTNSFQQKQVGFHGVWVKVPLGNFTTVQARMLAALVAKYAADDIRFTVQQGLLLRYVRDEHLPDVFEGLRAIGLDEVGHDRLSDITACPGTDTCNLGISNSTDTSLAIDRFIRARYPELAYNNDIKIKISGCMNSCGQHGLAHIGFHGSSFKVGEHTAPALQVVLGGGGTGNGEGRIAEKVIKVPSKRVLQVVGALLDDYVDHRMSDEELFNEYYDRQGKDYFYQLLKPLADTSNVTPDEFVDWGSEERFKTAIGVGECAGVMIDLVATLLFDADEKLVSASESLSEGRPADSIYFSYAAIIHCAKALLTERGIPVNTHANIIKDFGEQLSAEFGFRSAKEWEEFVLRIHAERPAVGFAKAFLKDATHFVQRTKDRQRSSVPNPLNP